MKRQDLIRQLTSHGCILVREGRSHSIWLNPKNNRQSSIPRHRDINEMTAKAILRQLEIPQR